MAVQEDLARLEQANGSDPWLEHRTAARLTQVRSLREALLSEWARIGLSWRVRGGRVELVMGGTVTAAPREEREDDPETEQPTQTVIIPSPVEAPRPIGPPADLSQIGAVNLGPAWSRAVQTRPREAEPDELKELLRPMADLPDEFSDPEAVRAELALLVEASTPVNTGRWLEMPKEIQRALVGHIVARSRHVQDDLGEGMLPADALPSLDRIFSHLTAFSKRWQPGFVFGLMRAHTPVHRSWLADARHWWKELEAQLPPEVVLNPEKALFDLQALLEEEGETEEIVAKALAALDAGVTPEDSRLVRLMQPRLSLLNKHARFKKLRKAIREAQLDDEAFEQEMAQAPPPLSEWSFASIVAGKRAAIVGGDLREDARRRIQEAFHFDSVDWYTTDHSRNIQALASSVIGGSLNFVIVLRRFIGHDVDRIVLPACKAADVPWVSVERGYGVNQIRLAIERFLSGAQAETLPS
jgi:hypothetical protein